MCVCVCGLKENKMFIMTPTQIRKICNKKKTQERSKPKKKTLKEKQFNINRRVCGYIEKCSMTLRFSDFRFLYPSISRSTEKPLLFSFCISVHICLSACVCVVDILMYNLNGLVSWNLLQFLYIFISFRNKTSNMFLRVCVSILLVY